MNHTTILNYLIEKHNLKSYLEIGVRTTEQNFDKINCQIKNGIDPALPWSNEIHNETSDTFFERYFSKVNNRTTFDLIFIDGLHHSDQVERDFNNSLKCLNDGGFIVIHDCLPTDQATTCIPRGNQKVWHGDVYKFVMKLSNYDGIRFVTINMDEGCCIVWKNNKYFGHKIIGNNLSASWKTFKEFGYKLMNVIEPEQFFKKELV